MTDKEFLGKNARLKKAPSKLLAATAFAEELSVATRLYSYFDYADCAHLLALERAKVLPLKLAVLLIEQIMLLRREGRKPEQFDPSIGDVYNNRDAFLTSIMGTSYGHVHFGRSRREATNLAWVLDLRMQLAGIAEAIADLIVVLAGRARNSTRLVLPDYTYLQRAHPTTLGHYLTAAAYPLLRDLARLEQALDFVDLSPAGIGSVNGTSYEIDRRFLADILNFSGVIENTRDGMWAADLPATVMSALAISAITIDRLCEDLQIWATSEFGFLELDDSHCRTSVIMPQKKNPYALAGLRGFCRTLTGGVVNAISTNMTPTGQPDNRIYAYGAVPEACGNFSRWTRLLTEVVLLMKVNDSPTGHFSPSDFVFATEAIDSLSLNAGMTNREAHDLVGSIVQRIVASKASEADIIEMFLSGLRDAGVSDAVLLLIKDITEPGEIIERRRGIGSAQPLEVSRMSDDLERRACDSKDRISKKSVNWTDTTLSKKIDTQLRDIKNAQRT